MTKPIRGEKGQFAGSIGNGKKAPTPSHIPQQATPSTEMAGVDTGATISAAYRQHLQQLAVRTDTEIASIYRDLATHLSTMHREMDALHHHLGHRRERVAHGRRLVAEYSSSGEETLLEAQQIVDDEEAPEWKKEPLRIALARYATAKEETGRLKIRLRQLNAVYLQHRWNRAFLVHGGHVHSSMECSTCNRQGNDTEFGWLPEYSGSDEEQIVSDAGERACTVCYPSAPVDVLQRPTRIFSEDERAQLAAAEERRAQREASRQARAAKAPTASGEPLICDAGETTFRGETRMRQVELKTERTALSYAADIVAAQRSGNNWMAPYEIQPTHYDSVVQEITASIAEKRGCSADEVLEEVIHKADIKVRKANR